MYNIKLAAAGPFLGIDGISLSCRSNTPFFMDISLVQFRRKCIPFIRWNSLLAKYVSSLHHKAFYYPMERCRIKPAFPSQVEKIFLVDRRFIIQYDIYIAMFGFYRYQIILFCGT